MFVHVMLVKLNLVKVLTSKRRHIDIVSNSKDMIHLTNPELENHHESGSTQKVDP